MGSFYRKAGVDLKAAEESTRALAQSLKGIGHFAGFFPKKAGEVLPTWMMISMPEGICRELLIRGKSPRLIPFLRRQINKRLTAYGFQATYAVDYLGVGRLDPGVFHPIGRQFNRIEDRLGFSIVGGETAEMSDIYQPEKAELVFWIGAKKGDTPPPSWEEADRFHVVSIDGVGTKSVLALQCERVEGLPFDLVNHCVNDLLCTGATPRAFYAYIGKHSSVDDSVEQIIRENLAAACREQGLQLMGCITRVADDVYRPGQIDFVGVITGEVAKDDVLTGEAVKIGDVLIGLPSSGLHTNGYSLIRKLIDFPRLKERLPSEVDSFAKLLLKPHRSYRGVIAKVRPYVKAIAHITGGGFYGNINRILPDGLKAVIRARIRTRGHWRWAWDRQPVYEVIDFALRDLKEGFYTPGSDGTMEAFRVLNQGIGLVLIVSLGDYKKIETLLPWHFKIGRVARSKGDEVRVEVIF